MNVKLELRVFTSNGPYIQGISQVEVQKIKPLMWADRLQHSAQMQQVTWAQLLPNSQSTELLLSINHLVHEDFPSHHQLRLQKYKYHVPSSVQSTGSVLQFWYQLSQLCFYAQVTSSVPLKYELKHTIMFHSSVLQLDHRVLCSHHSASLMAQR